ncbi:hypothetical protein P5673_026659 [Acropora cervicornis]|uniref:Uncharacterized protein n=1 Tax=Acropora cervicornis TaxID=6130 RepID=A0AAD9Q050_ACRCE|nr:hypothetical protein P5673_026659 [Acropora cervicornis]
MFVRLLMANFGSVLTMKRLFVAAAVCLGWLLQSIAGLSVVGNCSFMQYYCNVREYETCFFKRLYKDPTADCGLQFWMLYYKVLKESDKCQTTNDHMKSLTAAKVREIQTLYCSGLDLERPLMLSLSPCSDKHKQEVITCINDFAKTFSSLLFHRYVWFHRDRKRDKAKQCTIYSWRIFCNHSDVADGILKNVIGSFNPFCDGDKDPKAVQTDQCANYIKPLDLESCPLPITRPRAPGSSDKDGLSGGAIAGIVIGALRRLSVPTVVMNAVKMTD